MKLPSISPASENALKESPAPHSSTVPCRKLRRHPALKILSLVFVLVLAGEAQAGSTRDTACKLTSIFENSTPVLQYGYCENIHDGRGYTFGFAGFCSGTYDGTMLLVEYRRLLPGNLLEKYLPAFRAIDAGPHDREGRNPSTTGLEGFPEDVRTCGSDPAFRKAQDRLAGRLYWNPSQHIARHIGARLPITRGELYDAFLNHGANGARQIIRKTDRAAGKLKSGTDERAWLAKFLEIRLAILRADDTWKFAADRVAVYQRLLDQDNVRLRPPIRLTCYGDRFTLK